MGTFFKPQRNCWLLSKYLTWGKGILGGAWHRWVGSALYQGMKRRMCLKKSDSEVDCHADRVTGTPSELNFHWTRNQCDSTHSLCMERCVSWLPAMRWPASSPVEWKCLFRSKRHLPGWTSSKGKKHCGESLEPVLWVSGQTEMERSFVFVFAIVLLKIAQQSTCTPGLGEFLQWLSYVSHLKFLQRHENLHSQTMLGFVILLENSEKLEIKSFVSFFKKMR